MEYFTVLQVIGLIISLGGAAFGLWSVIRRRRAERNLRMHLAKEKAKLDAIILYYGVVRHKTASMASGHQKLTRGESRLWEPTVIELWIIDTGSD